jgi:signal transduction histidine kinase
MVKVNLISLLLFAALPIYASAGWHAFGSLGNYKAEAVEQATEKSIKMRLEQASLMREADVRQAIESAESALDDAISLDSTRLIGEAYLSLGLSYDYLGARPEALKYLNLSLEKFKEAGDQGKFALSMKQIGYIYYYSNEHNTAMGWFKKVFNLGLERRDTALIIAGVTGRGQVYGNTGRMDSATYLFTESFNLARATGNVEMEVQSLFYSGDVMLYSGKPAEALTVFRNLTEDYNLSIANPRIMASLYNSMTTAAILTGHYSDARKFSIKAFNSLNENSKLQHREDYYLNKFMLDTLDGNYRDALVNYRMYRTYFDSSSNSKFRRDLANLHIVEEMRLKESEITRLKNEGILKDLKIKQRKIVNWGAILLTVLISFILYQQWRTYKKIKAKNSRLEEQQEELEAAFANLKNTHRQLLQSEKMASLGLLASGVAHELNNPLNYIYGGVQCIKNYCDEKTGNCPPEMETYLKAINSGIERASAIVNGLHRFSPGREMRLKELNLNSISDTCLLMLNHMMAGTVETVKDYRCADCLVKGDEPQLHQVVLSILLNSIQAIKGYGTITVTTWKDDSQSCIKISDTGCGIEKSNLPHIFDPFFTTKDPGEGTGLGLSITFSIIKEHKGSIAVESEHGKGTEVIIKFPCS